MRSPIWLGTTIGLIAGIGSVATQVTQAVQLADGTVYFVQPPDLLEATTTSNTVDVLDARYYFTVSVPKNAGEPLQRVTITQREGIERIRYDLDDSRAFVGTQNRKGERLKLGEVTSDRKTRTVVVNFDPPVTPGKTVTVGLRPRKNPSFAGIYLFGVTAFPVGEKSHGQFIGFGRLHFYGGGIRPFGTPSRR